MGCTPSTEKKTGASLLTCPQGHGLKVKRADGAIKHCSKCKKSILDDYLVCEMCGYFSCRSCA